MTAEFVHLHNHMQGSYSDSALTVAGALDRVAKMGMKSFALTDHGEMAMVRTFAREAVARGIKPIVGMEAYFVEDAAANIRGRINDRYHLLLLAADPTGYANLTRIASRSWSENCLMQKLGLVDWKLLESCSAGIICLSGCLAGPLAWSFHKDHPEEADRFHGRLSELFGDRFFIEVFEHGMPEEKKATAGLLDIAKRYGRKIVLTNDCHYLSPEDWVIHDTLIKTRFGRPTDFQLAQHEYYIKTPAEMRGLGYPDAFSDATLEIADRITLTAEQILSPRPAAVERESIRAAFLGTRRRIGRARALEKAAGVRKLSRREQQAILKMPADEIKSAYPEVLEIAQKLEDLPEKPSPDFSRVVTADDLASRIPLRRMEKVLFTMWNEEDCVAAGAEIRPVEESPELLTLARATQFYTEGIEVYRRRQLEKARGLFLRALEQDPRFTNARYQLGLAEFYRGNLSAALTAFELVVYEEPDFERLPHLLSYTGWCRYRLNEFEAALRDFDQSLSMKVIPGSRLGRGLALEKLGRTDEASEALILYIQEHPDDGQVHVAHEAVERMVPAGGGIRA